MDIEEVENFNEAGKIIKTSKTKIIITEDGIQGKLVTYFYNILLNNGELAYDTWFNKYKIDENNNCIIGIKRDFDDIQRIKSFKIYTDDKGELNDKYSFSYGLINNNGILVIDPIYEKVKYAYENAYRVCYNAKYGFLSSLKKEQITPIIFDAAKKFHEGLASVIYNNKSGYVSRYYVMKNPDDDREYAIPPNYDYANDFIDGIAEVSYYGKKKYIDKNNNEIKLRNLKKNR